MAECKLNYTADEINRRLSLLDSSRGGGGEIWTYNMSQLTSKRSHTDKPILQSSAQSYNMYHPVFGTVPTLVYRYQLENCGGSQTNEKIDYITPSFETYQSGDNYYCQDPSYQVDDFGLYIDGEYIFLNRYFHAFELIDGESILDVDTVVSSGGRSGAGSAWSSNINLYFYIYCSSEEIITELRGESGGFDELFLDDGTIVEKFVILNNNYKAVEGQVN